jgi:D-lyxose ketol-isomerase
MKRSTINSVMRQADEFIRSRGYYLPPFAYWSPEEWRSKGPEAREIVEAELGWDITDFGKGDFSRSGLFMFTVRNGRPNSWKKRQDKPWSGQGKLYCEKLLIAEEKQATPMHFHWAKMEDIINRGGGQLAIQLYNATADDGLADTPVSVSLDGVARTVPVGTVLRLAPGESITLPQRLYHTFWAEGGRTLIGEVSLVNDDTADNRFLESVGRFPTIEEDEAPLYLLVTDYERYYPGQGYGNAA